MRRGKWYNNYNGDMSKTDWQQTKYVAYGVLSKFVNVAKTYVRITRNAVYVNISKGYERVNKPSLYVNISKQVMRKKPLSKFVNIDKNYTRKPTVPLMVNVFRTYVRISPESKRVNVYKTYNRKNVQSLKVNVYKTYQRDSSKLGKYNVNIFKDYIYNRKGKPVIMVQVFGEYNWFNPNTYLVKNVNVLLLYVQPNMDRFSYLAEEENENELPN